MNKLITKITMIALALSWFIPSVALAGYPGKTTSLHKAIISRNPEKAIKIINADKVDLNARTANKNHNSALHLAAYFGDKAVVELLIEKGADIEIRNNNKQTPIFSAIQGNQTEIAMLFVDEGAKLDVEHLSDKNYPDGSLYRRFTPLAYAIYCCDQKTAVHIINAMVEQGLNLEGNSYFNYLHQAIRVGTPKVVKHLIDNGVNVNNIEDINKGTPLIMAIEEYYSYFRRDYPMKERYLEIIKYLVDADLDIEDSIDRTPFQLATHYGLEDVADIITAKRNFAHGILNDIYYAVKNW